MTPGSETLMYRFSQNTFKKIFSMGLKFCVHSGGQMQKMTLTTLAEKSLSSTVKQPCNREKKLSRQLPHRLMDLGKCFFPEGSAKSFWMPFRAG